MLWKVMVEHTEIEIDLWPTINSSSKFRLPYDVNSDAAAAVPIFLAFAPSPIKDVSPNPGIDPDATATGHVDEI